MERPVGRNAPTIMALAAAAIALVTVVWFDNTVMRDVQEQARTSGLSSLATVTVLEELLVAGTVLLVGVLAWRSASVVVGLAFVVVGGFFVAQLWIWWNLAAQGERCAAGGGRLGPQEPLLRVYRRLPQRRRDDKRGC
jgi:hypothetical protein